MSRRVVEQVDDAVVAEGGDGLRTAGRVLANPRFLASKRLQQGWQHNWKEVVQLPSVLATLDVVKVLDKSAHNSNGKIDLVSITFLELRRHRFEVVIEYILEGVRSRVNIAKNFMLETKRNDASLTGSELRRGKGRPLKLVDDLFRSVPFSGHLSPLLRDYTWYRFRGAGHGDHRLNITMTQM